MTPVEDETSVN